MQSLLSCARNHLCGSDIVPSFPNFPRLDVLQLSHTSSDQRLETREDLVTSPHVCTHFVLLGVYVAKQPDSNHACTPPILVLNVRSSSFTFKMTDIRHFTSVASTGIQRWMVRRIYTIDCHICDLTWPHMTSSHSLHDMILRKFLVSIFLKRRCVTILHSSVIKFLPYFPVAYILHSLFHFYFLVVQYRSNSAVFNNDESVFCSNSWVIKTHSKFYNLKGGCVYCCSYQCCCLRGEC